MENLNLEKFSPKKAELISLADKCRNLEIKGLDDKEGYQVVGEHRKELKKVRIEIQKTGKMLRSDAITFQKAVIEREKEMIGVIEPVEKELELKQKTVDEGLEKIVRQSNLPFRKEQLQKIDVEVDDDFILSMDDATYKEFLNEKKSEYLEEKERKIEEEKEKERMKLEKEKRKLEEEKRIEEEKKKAREEERIQADKDAILAKEKTIEDARIAKEKADKEKQDIIDEQERKEQERLEKIEREKQIKAEEEAKAKLEAEELEKKKKYQDFLKKNEYTEQTKDNFYIQKDDNKITLFKKVDEIIIK